MEVRHMKGGVDDDNVCYKYIYLHMPLIMFVINIFMS